MNQNRIRAALELLDRHYDAFHSAAPFADATGHPVPMDTRGWSQILVSTLTGMRGLERKKGADLEDGSDVKGANTWKAIDTPRFNGVIKAGTKAEHSDRIDSLDAMPHLYFVLWDINSAGASRCRVWVVRTQVDAEFRGICEDWYQRRRDSTIKSANFQLHPPRGLDTNVFRNNCGCLEYPLLFSATRSNASGYSLQSSNARVLTTGQCKPVPILASSAR